MTLPPIDIPPNLNTIARIFQKAGRQCWLVGGGIRDGLLGIHSEDYDLATDAPPQEVQGLFHRTIPTGIKHGTVTILLGGGTYETTTFRRESDYSDGRRPDRISFAEGIEEDLSRRDFTINAIAWDLINHRLKDPHGGQEDLRRRRIRAIGNPRDRLEEDGLRSLRACRFSSQLEFEVEETTLQAIGETLHKIPGLSAERIGEEFKKIIASPRPSRGLQLFKRTGLLPLLLPELARLPEEDLWTLSLRACDSAPRENYPVRAAALFHSAAPPLPPGDSPPFPAPAAGQLCQTLLDRLKSPHKERDRVVRLITYRRFFHTEIKNDADLRRGIAQIGVDLLQDLFLLNQAVIQAGGQAPSPPLTTRQQQVDKVLASNAVFTMDKLAINGKILMRALSLSPGPAIGIILKDLLDYVLEDPQRNQEDQLLTRARQHLENNKE